MYKESMVLRNLAVLKRLSEGAASLEDIADSARYRPRLIERSLGVLVPQGLVQENGGRYELIGDNAMVSSALKLIDPWLAARHESFCEIAKDAAAIILHKSYSEARVKDILLYGSALDKSDPRDIDLVIFHDQGRKLDEFTPSRYAGENTEEIYDLDAGHPLTRRIESFYILKSLGYAVDHQKDYNVVRYLGERIESLGIGDVSEEDIRRDMRIFRCSREDVAADLDIYGIGSIFDVHVFDVSLLEDKEAVERELNDLGRYFKGDSFVEAKTEYLNRLAEQRRRAIDSCNDPTYWHSIFSEGRLYDPKQHDFSMAIEDRYPGALKLFEPPQK